MESEKKDKDRRQKMYVNVGVVAIVALIVLGALGGGLIIANSKNNKMTPREFLAGLFVHNRMKQIQSSSGGMKRRRRRPLAEDSQQRRMGLDATMKSYQDEKTGYWKDVGVDPTLADPGRFSEYNITGEEERLEQSMFPDFNIDSSYTQAIAEGAQDGPGYFEQTFPYKSQALEKMRNENIDALHPQDALSGALSGETLDMWDPRLIGVFDTMLPSMGKYGKMHDIRPDPADEYGNSLPAYQRDLNQKSLENSQPYNPADLMIPGVSYPFVPPQDGGLHARRYE